MTNIERAVKELQDNLVVISELEKRQSELLKIHSQRLVLLESETAEVAPADGQKPRPYCNQSRGNDGQAQRPYWLHVEPAASVASEIELAITSRQNLLAY